jgi:hypothetical protein
VSVDAFLQSRSGTRPSLTADSILQVCKGIGYRNCVQAPHLHFPTKKSPPPSSSSSYGSTVVIEERLEMHVMVFELWAAGRSGEWRTCCFRLPSRTFSQCGTFWVVTQTTRAHDVDASARPSPSSNSGLPAASTYRLNSRSCALSPRSSPHKAGIHSRG